MELELLDGDGSHRWTAWALGGAVVMAEIQRIDSLSRSPKTWTRNYERPLGRLSPASLPRVRAGTVCTRHAVTSNRTTEESELYGRMRITMSFWTVAFSKRVPLICG